MIKILLTGLALMLSQLASTQDLNEFNQHKQNINKRGLFALSTWSAANVIYGSVASAKTQGSTKYFHRMNSIWNAVTLGLSTFGYLSAKKETGLTFSQTLKKQASIEKVFLFNAGLDVAYIAGGFYMKERSKSLLETRDRNKGYGESIILQGSVLLLFDVLMYGIHNSHGNQLYKIADKVVISSTDNGVGVVVKL